MTWAVEHAAEVGALAWAHAYLAGIPLVLGLLVALPLGWAAQRWPVARPFLVAGAGLLYTVPSLALFVIMPLVLGTKILDPRNVIAAMTLYTVALLVRTVAEGLASVPESVRQSATAMGYRALPRLFAVELPLAVPVIAAGLRVAAVANVSMVSVASLIGVSQLGNLLTDGYQRLIPGELGAGIVACLVLALVFDLLIIALAAVLTPWRRHEAVRA